MTLAYAVETFADALNDIVLLIDPHWDEVGSFKEEFDRQIDFPAYRALEASGRLLTVTARVSNNELVGYFIGVLGNDLHRVTKTTPPRHVGTISALVYYMAPPNRGYGRSFIRAVEGFAAAKGVLISSIRAKPEMNAAGAFLSKIGYEVQEVVYTRLIGDAADAGRSRSGVD